MAGTKLEVAFVSQGSMLDEIVQEMLDHQGIIYDVLVYQPGEIKWKGENYAVAVFANSSEEILSIAKQVCATEKNLIDAGSLVDLPAVERCLSGEKDDRTDHLERLLVNESELKLREAIRNSFLQAGLPFVVKAFWPRNAKAACVLTHDIDWFSYSPFHKAVLNGNIGFPKLTELAFRSIFFRRDYGWNIPETIDLERKFNLVSTFYFQTRYEHRETTKLAQSFEKLRSAANFEIGLHAYHNAHKDAASLRNEIEEFKLATGSIPDGIRYHILKFTAPSTWLLEVAHGIKYDATFSYNEYFGFRADVCFPYHPFDGKNRLFSITELPTGFMDWTTLHRKQRGKLGESYMDKVMETVDRYNGALVVNFHNTYLNKDTFPDIFGLYERLLGQVSSGEYWVASARDCINWWNYRAGSHVHPRVTSSGELVVENSATLPLLVESEGGKMKRQIEG